jgi:hypothetical protein
MKRAKVEPRHYGLAAVYSLGSLVAGVGAVLVGMGLGRTLT